MQKSEKEERQLKKKEHAVIFEAVRGVIHHCDPYGLLAYGCPADEFDTEIGAVVCQVDRIGSVQDAVYVLSRVFSFYFDLENFRPEKCQVAGEHMYRILRERGISANSKSIAKTAN
ncbi:hypothetical protein B1R32_101183 [Abditibacterium utsteinense]|uniref:Uncharacterized protein n=1 Tax=Abditibacterium utsteinense TaxID=1960156 RepID=A0A2S8SXA8_9BACT|nr:hypothetical protein [Abditibacterium utsteinense]PQV65441.1 hypothetical protein B1R32_101183 [Abditibacterium utsteinense]